MNFYTEPVLHDRQEVVVAGLPVTTTSTDFVDIDGAVITTKDLGSDGTYMIFLSMGLNSSNNNSEVIFRGLVDGVPTQEREVPFGPGAGGNPQAVELQAFGSGISVGTEIKLQWKVSSGTATLLATSVIIDGVPDIRVVQ